MLGSCLIKTDGPYCLVKFETGKKNLAEYWRRDSLQSWRSIFVFMPGRSLTGRDLEGP